jgi:hypothetical protein
MNQPNCLLSSSKVIPSCNQATNTTTPSCQRSENRDKFIRWDIDADVAGPARPVVAASSSQIIDTNSADIRPLAGCLRCR